MASSRPSAVRPPLSGGDYDRLETLLQNLPGMAYRCLNLKHWPMDFVSDGCFDQCGYWAGDWKKQKLEKISLLLKAALDADDKVLLKLNVKAENLENVKALLPALHAPTVNSLTDDGWFAIETVVDESVVREIIPDLKNAGAEGIIEISLNKVVA